MYLIRHVIEHISNNNNNNATTLSALYSTVYFGIFLNNVPEGFCDILNVMKQFVLVCT